VSHENDSKVTQQASNLGLEDDDDGPSRGFDLSDAGGI